MTAPYQLPSDSQRSVAIATTPPAASSPATIPPETDVMPAR